MLVIDCAFPLTSYPKSYQGQPITGGSYYTAGDTPHIWTATEVAVLKQNYTFVLPIYVCSNPASRNATTDANEFAGDLKAFGAPKGIGVMLDYETAVDDAYETVFTSVMAKNGYLVILYGSGDTVIKNTRPASGYDEAVWTGKIPVSLPAGAVAEQFVDEGSYDVNSFSANAPLWNTKTNLPNGAVIAPPANSGTAAVKQLQELLDQHGQRLAVDGQRGPLTNAAFKEVLKGQNLRSGSNGYYVQVVQAMLNCWGYRLQIDGQFGPNTANATRSFQQGHKLSMDGQVGPLTQAKLAS